MQTKHLKINNYSRYRVLLALPIIAGVAWIGVQVLGSSHADTPASSFVTHSSSQLLLSGKPFRFSGVNMYWLGLDDNIRDSSGNPTYPTQARINDGFNEASSLGTTVVRAHTLGISIGCSNCIEPALGQFNDAAFNSIDYSVEQAGKHNIKLMIPLVDQWRYYHGGKWVFVHWAAQAGVPGVQDTNSDLSKNAGNDSGGATSEKLLEEQFYTNPTIIADYEAYISHVMNHVNQYTGVALKNDPTIMDWETGNELFDAPPAWTEQIASYIKNSVGAKQLVADGSAASGAHVSSAALTAPDVDIVGGHFYDYPSGLDTNWLNQDANLAASNGKAYIVGEYGWSRSDAAPFLAAIQSNTNVSGDLLWALLPHEENGTPEPHGSTSYGSDDVALYYPGTDSTMKNDIANLQAHSSAMTGQSSIVSTAPVPVNPTVSFTAPTNGTTVTGNTTVNAVASEKNNGDNISKADFYVDSSGTPFKTISGSGPYGFSWDTTALSSGSHTLKAVITDSAGLSGSASIVVVVPTTTASPTPVNNTPAAGIITINDSVTGNAVNQFHYTGDSWQTSQNTGEYQGDDHYDQNANDSVSLQFNGTGMVYWYSQASHHGIANVSIDGGPSVTVDQYALNRTDGVAHWTSPALTAGNHTLTITVSGNKNPASSNTVITLDRVDVLNNGNTAITTAPIPTCSADPSAPADFSAGAVKPTQIALSWSSSSAGTNCSLSGYTISRNGSKLATLSSSTTGYTDTSVTANTNYTYTISAFDAKGHVSLTSNLSTKTAAPVVVATLPAPPSQVLATVSSANQINLNWVASADSTVTAYRIYRNGSLITTTNNSNFYSDTTISDNSSYSYSVSAVNSAGESSRQSAAPASLVTPKVTDNQPPSAPGSMQSSIITANTIALYWYPSSDNISVAGYHIYRDGVHIGDSKGLSYTDSGLKSSTYYTYYVVAYDGAGNVSQQSNTCAGTTTNAPAGSNVTANLLITPLTSNTSVAIAANSKVIVKAPVTLATSSKTNTPIKSVSYTLNNKAITASSSRTAVLKTNTLRNGTYKLASYITYDSGAKATVAQEITVKNTASVNQFALVMWHYLWVLLPLGLIAVLFVRPRTTSLRHSRQSVSSQPIAAPINQTNQPGEIIKPTDDPKL